MVEVIGIRFKESSKTYYYNPSGETVRRGDIVMVESNDILKPCIVTKPNFFIDELDVVGSLKSIIRVATEDDLQTIKENNDLSARAYELCRQEIQKHGLKMYLSNATYSFDRKTIYFYYTAPERVDFRELVKDLARIFHTRVELRQIGNRDECQMFGGGGVCGRQFCCNTFLREFRQLQIKSAKKQRIAMTASKLTGPCERLRCCLKFEDETYDELIKETPPIDSLVKTAEGIATVIDNNLISGNIKIHHTEIEGSTPMWVHKDEVERYRKPTTKKNDNKQTGGNQ
jgi:cell fate regulator YaaT (PSP1 superfamily)